ncbi:MAG: hypothetical protein Q3966_06605 [Neisseria sp.]|nr:hypothetical protein [Neisseria sp.]
MPGPDGLFVLLQRCFLSEPSPDVREDILQLLGDYCCRPLDVLRENLSGLTGRWRKEVLRLLAQG